MLNEHKTALMERMGAMYPDADVRLDRYGNIQFNLTLAGREKDNTVSTTVLSDAEWVSWVKYLSSVGYKPKQDA